MNESTATRYQRLRRQAHVIGLATGIAWLACVGLTPLAGVLAEGAAALTAGWPEAWRPIAMPVVFVAGLALGWELLALPITWQAALRAERLRRRRVESLDVVVAQVRDAVIGVGIAIAAAGVVAGAVMVAGERWWMLAGLATLPLSLGAGSLAAAAIRTTSRAGVSRADVAAGLERLAKQTTGQTMAVHELDDPDNPAPTAAVTGLGSKGSIVLRRSMVRDWPEPEIVVIVAHELAHLMRRDVWRKAALDAVVATAALWTANRWVPITGVSGSAGIALASLPLLALVVWVTWLALRPIRLAQSRAHERAADRWAVRVTGTPEALRSAIRRMESRHLAEERPSSVTRWFFHRHPTVAERLSAIGE